MKQLQLVLGVTSLLFIASVQLSAGKATIRLAHASPDAPAIDVYIDDELSLTDLEFTDVTDYSDLKAGQHNITITAAEDSKPVLEKMVDLKDDVVYTIAAVGKLDNIEAAVFEDDWDSSRSDHAQVGWVWWHFIKERLLSCALCHR